MTKAELVAAIQAKTSIETKVKAEETLNAIFAAITEGLANGESVPLPGFGTFKVVSRAARKGRNPRTGETINIPASKAPTFSASSVLKKALN